MKSSIIQTRWNFTRALSFIKHVPQVFPLFERCYDQGRRLASTRRLEADSFANGPTSLSSCRPAGPTTWLGMKLVKGDRGRTSAVQFVYRRISIYSDDALFLLSASPSWYWNRHLPDYYYITVQCRYRHLPSRRDTNIIVIYSPSNHASLFQ